MHIAKILATSALALGMEMVGVDPFAQQPVNPPNPIAPINPTPQPPPKVPGQQPKVTLPGPSVPTRNNEPSTTPPNGTNPNGVNPNGANSNTAILTNSGSGVVVRSANRPFMFQSPQMEARFTENMHRLTQMEQRLEQSNQELLRRLGEARQLTGERQNTALMDLLQQLLQNNAEMQRYMVHSRMGWAGGPDEASDPANDQSSDNNQPQTPGNQQPRTQVPNNNTPPR